MIVDNYRFEEDSDGGLNLIVYLDYSTELSSELANSESESYINIKEAVKGFVKGNFPAIRINLVKVMVGTTLITSLSLSPVLAGTGSTNIYAVQAGDSLWKIASQYGISIEQLKDYNNLTSDVINVGQNLNIPSKGSQATADINIVLNGEAQSFDPPPVVLEGTTYLPIEEFSEALGATVWWNSESQTVGINLDTTKIAFVIGSTTARVDGKLVNTPTSRVINNTTYVPARFVSETFGLNVSWDGSTNTITIADPVQNTQNTYTVVAGDNLWIIANRLGTTISALKSANNLTSDMITVGQKLVIPAKQPSVTYINHAVSQGDNIWDLSIQYGIPMTELLAANNLTMNSMLTLGQVLKIPVHQIPVKSVVSDKHGELLDWWTEAQYVFTIGTVAKVTDFETGRTWNVKRTIGANHADSEPLTAQDAAIMKDVWGGEYSWDTRPVIVEVDGRKIAASMTSTPHSIQYITNNNFNGHFDIHFLNSTRHVDGEINWSHQQDIKVAAGVKI